MPMSEYMHNLRQKIGHDLLISPGVTAIILNDDGHLLLQHRVDGYWGLPGGALEPGEHPAEGLVREVFEENGIQVVPERIVGVYGGPDTLWTYDNGDQMAFVSIAFICRLVAGEPHVHDDESLDVRYFPLDALPEPLLPHHRQRIQDAQRNDRQAFFWFNNTSTSVDRG